MVNEDNKPYIGITGITCKEDVEIIKQALGDSYGMYGVLVSDETLKGGKPHRGRYPNIDAIKDIFRVIPENALRAVHYNSEHGDSLSKDIEEIVRLTDGLCNCIQLNIEYPPLDQVVAIKNENKDLKIIFQLGKDSMKGKAYKNVAAKIGPYVPYIDYILIDASQGAGKELKIIDTIEFAKPLRSLRPLVFAGGLDGFSLYLFISLIEEFCASVDAEGKLMNNNDTLDHEKLKLYVRAAKTIKGFKPEVKNYTEEEAINKINYIQGK
jgi:phosphoribosylanthranilate isomerase